MTSQTCNRIDLAHEQLEMAIVAFLELERFASAITLASAAERVLGQALRHAGKQSVLDWKFEATDLVHAALHGKSLARGAFTDARTGLATRCATLTKGMPLILKLTSRRLRAGCWCGPARTRIGSD